MAAHIHLFSRSEYPRRSLVARGGLARTFGSLACFLALTFLGFGVYILADAFADPIAAQSGALVAAAFIIALASILLFYLFKPKRRLRIARIEHTHRMHSSSRRHDKTGAPGKIRESGVRLELPYGRRATDHVRART
jgi:hypothetical protein